jgi:hypothetical protein
MARALLRLPPMRAVPAALVPAALAAALAGCGVAAAPAGPRAPRTAEIAVFESAADHVTEGETILEVEPDVAYAEIADYAHWPHIFPAVRQAIVTARDGDDARVTFIGDADGDPDHHDNVHFHNRPATRTIWFEDTGGRAVVWAETTFAPGPRPGTTRVHSRLYADVHGVLSLVVTDANLRDRRQSRVAGDLTNLRAYFEHDVARAGRGTGGATTTSSTSMRTASNLR